MTSAISIALMTILAIYKKLILVFSFNINEIPRNTNIEAIIGIITDLSKYPGDIDFEYI